MTFFYDLNKRLANLATKQDAKQISEDAKATAPKSKLAESMEVAERSTGDYSAKKARAGKDIGKPGKMFSKIAKSAGKEYGSKERGEKVAGAVLAKLRHPKESMTNEGMCPSCDCSPCKCDSMEESALQAYLGNKKYGKQGMDALRKAGRKHAGKEKMAKIRSKYDKMDEADMEEGNAFTGALAKTPKGGKFKVGNKEFTDTSSIEEGFADMDAWLAQREKEKGTGKFDVKDTGYSKRYTRKAEEPTSDEEVGAEPKRRGRPKGAPKGPERVTAKSYKYKAGRPTKTAENLDSDGVMMTRPSNMSSEGVDHGEYDREGDMAKEQMHTIMSAAKELHSILSDEENLPEWVQKKISIAQEYIDAARDYMLTQHAERDEAVAEVAPPGAKAERMVKHIKKAYSKDGKLTPKEKAIAYATTWKAKKAGQVEEQGAKPDFLDLDKDGDKKEPMKKAAKEKKVDETTTSGSVATATTSGKSSKGGMQFGKGVYEGFNSSVEKMITESLSIESTMEECSDDVGQGITIRADGEEAAKLMQLLKLAGLSESSCTTCGKTPCGCEELDENSPDWPTNTETLDAEPNLRTYSGGLNGPKSTGQSTTVGGGIPNYQASRQVSMEENIELERNLFKTWKNYKG